MTSSTDTDATTPDPTAGHAGSVGWSASADSLVPLACAACGAPVPAVAAASTVCPTCGAEVSVPLRHQQALEALRAEDAAVARANAAWRAATRFAVPRWLDRVLQLAPALVFWGGLATFAVLGSVAPRADPSVAHRIGTTVFLPLELAVVIMVAVYWLRPTRRVVDQIALPLVAVVPSAGAAPACRVCGAPLTVVSRETFVRCTYCRADSLVGYSTATLHRLATSTRAASASAGEAVAQLEGAVTAASKNSAVIGLINAVPVAVLCAWSFVPGLREYFVVNLLVVAALAFEGLIVGASAAAVFDPIVAQGGSSDHPAGALVAASLFGAPVLFFAGMGTALGWIEASPANAVLFGVIFAVPILLFLREAWLSYRRRRRTR